jgi:putative transposase
MKPAKEHATNTGHTYMVTSTTWNRCGHFRNESWAHLLIDTLYHYRGSAYLLHEFVIMSDHIHVLLTPKTTLERAVQFIKGGFSFRAKKELRSNWEVWQKGFSDHRIRDARDYAEHVQYIRQNPVSVRLCLSAEEFPYSSAHPGFELDLVPQGLKPNSMDGSDGAAEAAPFQSRERVTAQSIPLQNGKGGALEGMPLQIKSNVSISKKTA